MWKLIKTLSISTDLIIKIFIAFFIWENLQNLNIIAIFGLIYFATLPFGSLISGIIGEQINPKIPFIAAFLIQIIQISTILRLQYNINMETVMLIGMLGGLGEGLKSVAGSYIDFSIRQETDKSKFYAKKTFVTQLLNLFMPMVAALLVTVTGEYNLLFMSILVLLIIQSGLLAISKIPTIRNTFDLDEILKIPGTNKDKPILIKGIFIEGLEDSITRTILPIIILVMVGSILNWGLINSALVVISIAASYLISSLIKDNYSQVLYALFSMIFAAISMIFLVRYDFFLVLLFLIFLSLMEIVKGTSYYSTLDKIIEEDKKGYQLYPEYKFLEDLVASLARVLPLIAIIVFGIGFENGITIRLLLLYVGSIPLLTISLLGRSRIFNINYKEEMTINSARKENLPSLDPNRS